MAREYLDQNKQFFVGSDTATATKPTPVVTPPAQPVVPPKTKPIIANAPVAVTPPQLPKPVAVENYITAAPSLTANLETQRKALDDTYKQQIAEIDKKQAEAEKRLAEFTKKEEGIINGPVKNLQQPFREDLERRDRERLSINENFQANQKLIGELDGLLTESNAMIDKLQNQKVPGLAGLQQSPRIVNALNNIEARVGVINAVMASRNNQIGVAENMIDRSVNAINADRQDQLNYYQTLFDFYDMQRDEEGNKLIKLDEKEETFLSAQIGLLEDDLKRSQETADYIKKLMISPDTAKFMADAGVTLNDSIETIQSKMATQSTRQERLDEAEVNKKLAFDNGVKTLFFNRGGEIARASDGWGFASEAEFQEMTGMTIAEAQAKGMITDLTNRTLVESDRKFNRDVLESDREFNEAVRQADRSFELSSRSLVENDDGTQTVVNLLDGTKRDVTGTGYWDLYGPITGENGSSAWKYGLDVDLKIGDPVLAPGSGTVIAVGENGGFGNQVKIRMDSGEEVWLSHLSEGAVKVGQKVSAGDVVGVGGNTGNVIPGKGGDGSHLDFTVKTSDGTLMSAPQAKAWANKAFTASQSKYTSEFEARVDFDQDLQTAAALKGSGEALPAPSTAIAELVKEYGKYISKSEIEGAVYNIYGVQPRPQAQAPGERPKSPAQLAEEKRRKEQSFGSTISRNLGEFKDTLLGK